MFEKIRTNIARDRAAKKLRSAAGGEPTELREFVYMNDVSLYSLFTSLIGALADSYTEAESQSLRSTIDASVEASAPMVAKGTIRSSIESNRSASRQVLRRATVQSTFRSFLGTARHQILPTRSEKDGSSSASKTVAEVPGVNSMAASGLQRGQLLELDVSLRPQRVFEFLAAMDAIGGIGALTPAVLDGLGDRSNIEALRELLVGLIPLEATVADWVAISTSDGHLKLVHSEVLPTLESSEVATSRPIKLVGSASESLFWRDIRTVIFGEQTFRVLVRIDSGGIQDRWNPLKLIDVLRTFDPVAADDLVDSFLLAIDTPMTPTAKAELRDVAERFTGAITTAHRWDPIDSDEVHVILSQFDLADFDSRRVAFDAAAQLIAGDRELNREIVAGSRDQALVLPTTAAEAPSTRETAAYIEVEFIAIYW